MVKSSTLVAILGTIGAGAFAIYTFWEAIADKIKPPPLGAPEETINCYFDNVVFTGGKHYLSIWIKDECADTGLSPMDFPSNSQVWIDNEMIGTLSESAYKLAYPGYTGGRAINIPVKYINTGLHIITYDIPGVGVERTQQWL